MKSICEATHGQLAEGTCPWCDVELDRSGSLTDCIPSRSGKVLWNSKALWAGLEDKNPEVRSITISNVMFEHGPELPLALPLLAFALRDKAIKVSDLAEMCLTRLGTDVSLAEAQAFEWEVEGSPNELAIRILLLGYYFLGQRKSQLDHDARQSHIHWLVQNAPSSKTAGSPYALVTNRDNHDSYAKTRELWIDQIQAHSDNAAVIRHAANFFVLSDEALSEELFKRGKALEPENPHWSEGLAHLYSLRSRGENNVRTEYARLAYEELKASEQMQLTANDVSEDGIDSSGTKLIARLHSLRNLARAAVDADEFDDARRYASELLALAQSESLPDLFRNEGNAIHYSHQVLGQCELRDGRIALAKEHLINSGKTTGSPNLGSFGPNMYLAKMLLEVGERDVVLVYFHLCKDFWKSGVDELKQWTEQIERGDIPDFGANLYY